MSVHRASIREKERGSIALPSKNLLQRSVNASVDIYKSQLPRPKNTLNYH